MLATATVASSPARAGYQATATADYSCRIVSLSYKPVEHYLLYPVHAINNHTCTDTLYINYVWSPQSWCVYPLKNDCKHTFVMHYRIHAFVNNSAACMWNKYVYMWLPNEVRNWISLKMAPRRKLEQGMSNLTNLTSCQTCTRLPTMTQCHCIPLVQTVRYRWSLQ